MLHNPGALVVKNLLANPGDIEMQIRSQSQRKELLPTPVFLPGEFHGQKSLVGYNPWGRKESDTTDYINKLTEK